MTRIIAGDCLDALRTLSPASVHCVVTSPPYWRLRDYGVAGQIGLENTLTEYIDKMVAVFREVRRVLRHDGTLWLNLGDSYAASGMGGNPAESQHRKQATNHGSLIAGRSAPLGCKPKDLLMMPARVVLALCDDGWYLRSEIVWAKCAPMPESVTDRPTSAHEKIFLLSKRRKYFYDAEAVKEDAMSGAGNTFTAYHKKIIENSPLTGGLGQKQPWNDIGGKRNMRNVWNLSPEPFPEAHFATFPTEIPRRAILAGTSARGVCPKCGAPWERVVSHESRPNTGRGVHPQIGGRPHRNPGGGVGTDARTHIDGRWQPSCTCDAGDPVPATILDPFLGSGTTAIVADQLGRDCIGIELNPSYAAMAERRLRGDAGLFAQIVSAKTSAEMADIGRQQPSDAA